MKAEITPVRTIMGRLAKGADLLGALEEQCRAPQYHPRGGLGHRRGDQGQDRLL